MEIKEIKINCPEGFEVDKENSTFECIKFKPIKKELPKTWKEFCETHRQKIGEYYLNRDSSIKMILANGSTRESDYDRNILPSRELAEAMLALCQLIQLRDCYNDGWSPNWKDTKIKWYIYSFKDNINLYNDMWQSHVLSFKTEELRNEFYNNFKDLIEIAKPLL